MRLDAEVEAAWKRFKTEAEQAGADAAQDEEFGSYTDRDPISESWETKNKLVRLDDAIMALHLMAARHTFHGVARTWIKILQFMAERVAGFLASAAAKRVIKQVVSRNVFGNLASIIGATIRESAVQRDIESSLRTASFSVRADLFREPLKANPRRLRKTKLVCSRHG